MQRRMHESLSRSWGTSGQWQRLSASTPRPSPISMRPVVSVLKSFVVILSLSLGLSPISALGAPQPIEQGEAAPFPGILIPTDEAAAMVVRVEQASERAALEVAKVTRIHEADLRLAEERSAVRLDAAVQRAEIYRTALKDRDAWYRNEALWFALGVVSAVVVTGVAGYTFSELASAGVR